MYIMCDEPAKDISVEQFEEYFKGKETIQDIVDAYAISHNKFWWVEDNEYDFEEGTAEYEQACEITNQWAKVMDKYTDMIFTFIKAEGKTIPEKGQIEVLAPFMKKFGYIDGNGWWIKESKGE